jgi:hypothetical protein
MGLSLSLYSHYQIAWYTLLGLIIVVILFQLILKKSGYYKNNNYINTITWMMIGYGIMGWEYLVTWGFFIIAFTLVFHIIKNYLIKIKEQVPYYYLLFCVFFCNNILWQLY